MVSILAGDLMKVKFVVSYLAVALVVNQGALHNAFAMVKDISVGFRYTCVLTEAGGIKCFGNNEYGQLGDGTSVNSKFPVNVVDPSDPSGLLTGAVDISAGGRFEGIHSCALREDGFAECWGAGELGQLGNLSFANSYVPVTC